MTKVIKNEQVKVKVYQHEGNGGYTMICGINEVETELKKISLKEDSLYGIQIVFNTEKYISDYIGNDDVYKMDSEAFQNLQADTDLQDELISILIGMKLQGKEEEIKNMLPLYDIWSIQGRRWSEGHDFGGFEEDIYAEYIKIGKQVING